MRVIPADLDILPPRPVLFPWLPSSMECFLDLGLYSCCFGAEGTVGLDEAPAHQTLFTFDDDDKDCSDKVVDGATIAAAAATTTIAADHKTRKPLTPATQPLSPSEFSFESSSSRSRGDHRGISLKPLFGEDRVAAGHGTTTILVLSRDEDDDHVVDEIPDMSPTDDTLSDAGSYRYDDPHNDDASSFYNTKTKFYQPKAKLVSLADVLAEVLRVLVFFLSATGRVRKPLLSQDHERQTVASH